MLLVSFGTKVRRVEPQTVPLEVIGRRSVLETGAARDPLRRAIERLVCAVYQARQDRVHPAAAI